jgi:thiol:disulfide interchange protein
MCLGMRIWVALAALGIGAFLARARLSKHAPSFEAALASARGARAPLVLEFSMTGCAPCRLFECTILTSPDVQDAVKRVHFVRYNVTEDAAGRDAAERLGVQAYPTVLVVGDNGREQARMEGFPAGPPGAAYFAAFLRKAARDAN